MRKIWYHLISFRCEGKYLILRTLSSLFVSSWRFGTQACKANSKCGRTSDLYSCIMLDSFLNVKVLFIRPSILFALFTVAVHCLDGSISLLMMTPKSFSSVTT